MLSQTKKKLFLAAYTGVHFVNLQKQSFCSALVDKR